MLPFRTKVGGLLAAANDTFDRITGVAKGIMCIPSLFKSFASTVATTNLLGAAAQAAAQLASAVAGMVLSAVQDAVNQVLGTVANLINQQLKLIQELFATLNDIKQFITSIDDKAKEALDYIKNQENCKFAAGNLLSCVINSVANLSPKNLGSQLPSLNSVTDKVNSIADDITSKITQVGSKANVVTNFIDDNLNALDKARKSIAIQNM